MRFTGATGAASVLTHRYMHGPDGQALVDEVFNAAGQSTEVLWLLADQQGTVQDVVSDNGVLRKHIDYDSFGKVTGEQFYTLNGTAVTSTHAEAIEQLFGYTGQERDKTTGLQQHGARWYDPSTARWLSEDPIAFAGGDKS
jgi:RHS repeat-associated protein